VEQGLKRALGKRIWKEGFEEGKKHREIKRFVKERYSVELDLSTITKYYNPWDEVIEAYGEQAKTQKR